MKFTTNTKKLQEVLNLGIIKSNISRFYKKSSIAQLRATDTELIINLESNQIVTQINIRGTGDEKESACVFVDSQTLGNIVSTIESNKICFEFVQGGVVLHSDHNKFTLPSVINETDFELAVPSKKFGKELKFGRHHWKSVFDNQMFAIAKSLINPIYTMVWVGENGDVIVGDYDNGIFTHSMDNDLVTTCLLTDTIITMLTTVPTSTKLYKCKDSKSFILKYESTSDGAAESIGEYVYVTEFTPKYEDDGVESYSAEIILKTFEKTDNIFTVNTKQISKFLSQASILSVGYSPIINFSYKDNVITLTDSYSEGKLSAEGNCFDFDLKFNRPLIHSVFTKYADSQVTICPRVLDGDIVGLLIWNDDFLTEIAGLE